jgi:hypothetical protein
MDSPASRRSGRPRARGVPPGTTGRSPSASWRRWDRVVGVEESPVLFDAGRRLAVDAAVFGRKRL